MSKFVFILGMHRSGTSCLAGSLARCGLHLGDDLFAGRFNTRGYYEQKSVVRLHDQILGLNRGAWYRLPDRIRVHPYHVQALKQIADQLSQHMPCGLKDPRLVLVLDTWLGLVETPHALVGTFRHPVAVAQSLTRRNGMSEAEAMDLWLHYNTALIRCHHTTPFPIVEFDLSNVDAYCRTVETMAYRLGLCPSFFQLRRFVSRDLEHYAAADAPVPPQCQEAYAYLRHHRCRFDDVVSTTCSSESRYRLPKWQHLTKNRMRLPGLMREAAFLSRHSKSLLLSHCRRVLRRVIGQT